MLPHNPSPTEYGAPPHEGQIPRLHHDPGRAMGRHDFGSFAAFGRDAGLKTGAPEHFAVRRAQRATSPAGFKAG